MSLDTSQFETLSGFSPPSTPGPHTADDYWKLPEGAPVELIQGRLVVSPAPSFLHQTISLLLSEILLSTARSSGGRAAASPIDVELGDESIVQPDLVYVSKDRREIVKGRVHGAPDLVIEIISQNDARRDRVDKLNLYARCGVAEYWIVDPEQRQFDFLVNDAGRFVVQPQHDDRYQSLRLTELSINLVEFWEEVARHTDDSSSG